MNQQGLGTKGAVGAALLVLSLSLAACGSSASSGAAPTTSASAATSSAASSSSAPSSSTGSADAPFGAGCAEVPTSGKGSFDGMSSDPVATAASNNPLLSTLTGAVMAAGLVDTLNNTDDITVFAPSNAAFQAMDRAELEKLAKNKKQLTTVLTGHVVAGRLAPSDLAGEHTTLAKNKITVTGSGESFTINGSAKVVCGNVQTKNATVYIIDQVLTPKS